jgi:hypothetical protein
MIRTKVDKNQKWLTIKIPMQTPKPSKSGKNLVVATSSGPRSDEATFNGKPIRAVASAWIPNEKPAESTATEKKAIPSDNIDENPLRPKRK